MPFPALATNLHPAELGVGDGFLEAKDQLRYARYGSMNGGTDHPMKIDIISTETSHYWGVHTSWTNPYMSTYVNIYT